MTHPLLAQIQERAQKEVNTLTDFLAIAGEEWAENQSLSIHNKLINIHARPDWKEVYRHLRHAGASRIKSRSIMPYGDEFRATFYIYMDMKAIELCIIGDIDDYRRFIRHGATCRRESVMEKLVCE